MIFVITGTVDGAVVMVMVRSRVLEIIFNSNTGKVLAVRRHKTGNIYQSIMRRVSYRAALYNTIQYSKYQDKRSRLGRPQ